MAVQLGAPSYSFQYSNQTSGVEAGSRTINNLNFKMSEQDDGITPQDWYAFFNNVMTGLGLTIGTTQPKVTENRLYETV